jgi:hypothetical protein
MPTIMQDKQLSVVGKNENFARFEDILKEEVAINSGFAGYSRKFARRQWRKSLGEMFSMRNSPLAPANMKFRRFSHA